MLYELLSWITTSLLGEHSEASYRIWSVLPTIAAVFLGFLWLRRRLDLATACVFCVLAAASPVYLDLGPQAHGFGLTFLLGLLLVISADAQLWRPSRARLAMFALVGTLGTLTLSDFVLPFLGVAALMASRREQRRGVVTAVALAGVVCLLWYAPVLGQLIANAGQNYGQQLPWYGAVSRPLADLLQPSVSLMLPSLTSRAGEILAAVVLAFGTWTIWRRPERLLAGLLVIPSLLSYLVLEIGRFHVAPPFLSFLLLPLLCACAAAFSGVSAWLARIFPYRVVPATVLAVALALLVLGDAYRLGHAWSEVPFEGYKTAAAIVSRTGISRVVTNDPRPKGFCYYLGGGNLARGRRLVVALDPSALHRLLCAGPPPFVFLEHDVAAAFDTTCLYARGAISIAVPQRRANTITIWLVNR
jgi:hypothetical protein